MRTVVRLGLLAVVAGIAIAGCGDQSGTATPPSVATSSPPGTASPTASVPPSSAAATPTPASAVTPTPVVSPPPSPTASPSPAASPAGARTYASTGSIGDVLFAPDGRIVVVEEDWAAQRSQVVALSADGVPLPGWPWSAGATGDPIAIAALGPGGSVYVAVRGAAGIPVVHSWLLHRLHPDGTEMAGFPVALPTASYCELLADPLGTAYAACQADDEATGTETTTVRAVLPDGSAPSGWPVTLAGAGSMAGFRPDGGVVVTVDAARITVLGRDGSTASGWPTRVRGGVGSVVLDARGRVRVTSHRWLAGECAPAASTTYTLLRLDGSVAAGWPVKLTGWASDPAVAGDGTMVVVTRAGRAIRYSAAGHVLNGWPVSNVPVSAACSVGSSPVDVGARGVVVTGAGKATLITRDGRLPRGWPATLPYRLATGCPSCTPGPAGPLTPAVGTNGLFVAAYRGDRPRIIGIAWDGALPKAWQRALGRNGDEVEQVQVAPDGRVWVVLSRWDNEAQATLGFLVPAAQDGTLRD